MLYEIHIHVIHVYISEIFLREHAESFLGFCGRVFLPEGLMGWVARGCEELGKGEEKAEGCAC